MKKANLTTAFLLIYLLVMAIFGWKNYAAEGAYLAYFGLIAVTLIIIFLLRYVLIRKNKLREEHRKRMHAAERRNFRNDNIH